MLTRYNENGRKITCNADQVTQMEEIGYKLKESPNKISDILEEVNYASEVQKVTSPTRKNTRQTKKMPDIVL